MRRDGGGKLGTGVRVVRFALLEKYTNKRKLKTKSLSTISLIVVHDLILKYFVNYSFLCIINYYSLA